LDEFDRTLLLDELRWRAARMATVQREASVATAGALLVVGAAREEAAARSLAHDRALDVLQQASTRFSDHTIAEDVAKALAPRLREIVRPVVVPPDDAFVDQDIGLFDRALYLRLARKNAFANTKHGKKRVARWSDVKAAFIKAGAEVTVLEPTSDPETDLLNEIRQRAGLAVKGGR
jgi:hypothetical protein